jgi:hypothetical protein
MKRLAVLLACLFPVSAMAGLAVNAGINFDGSFNTQYRAGDKPQGGGDTFLSGYTGGALGTATCSFTALDSDTQQITGNNVDGFCTVHVAIGSEANQHIKERINANPIWNTKPFARGGVYLGSSTWNSGYAAHVGWVQDTLTRFRANEFGTFYSAVGSTCTTLPCYVAIEYEAATDIVCGYESPDNSTWTRIGNCQTATSAIASGNRKGLFLNSSNDGSSITMSFDVITNDNTLRLGGSNQPPDPDPPGSNTEAILAKITNYGSGPFAHGHSQGSGGWPTNTNTWQTWLGQQLDITHVWDSASCATTWSVWDSGSGCDNNKDVMASDSGVPDTTTLVISRPLWPAEYADNDSCPSSAQTAWANAATGALDAHYNTWATNFAARLASVGRNPNSVVIRLGWEMTGNWYPWSVCASQANNVTNFKATWNRVVAIIRGKLPGIMIDFGPARQQASSTCNLTCMSSGLDYDIQSRSLHDGPSPNGFATSESAFFTQQRTTGSSFISLDEVRAVALANDKPFGFGESGTQLGENDPLGPCDGSWLKAPNPDIFIKEVHDFLTEPESVGKVAYYIYFSSSCSSIMTRQSHPAAIMYKSLFQ